MIQDATPLWTAPDVAAAVAGTLQVPLPETLTGVSIDSRTLAPGDLFIALSGPRFNGNDFVGAAFQAGAGAAIATSDDLAPGQPILKVADTQQALEQLGAARRRATSARIAAITGSVGKTSSKEMLAAVLGACGPTHASPGSFNNHWGVPLSLARMPQATQFAVFELGMNHAGEIAALTRQVRPDLAIITLVAAAHLEFFASVDAIADAKAEIFQGMQPGSPALLNADNDQFGRLVRSAEAHALRVVPFGRGADCPARLLALTPLEDGSWVEASIEGQTLSYRLPLAGRHMAMNSVAVLAAAHHLGADIAIGARALAGLQALGGRGRRVEIAVAEGTAMLIDESYNASPAAMKASLQVLGASPAAGRRIAILGDMRELGERGPELHATLAETVEADRIDQIYTVGPLMRHLRDTLDPRRHAAHADSAADLLPILAQNLRAGDLVMVKGSLGTRMADIVGPLIAGAASKK